MYYRHNIDYKYPDKCDEHMIVVKKKRDINFDENFDYVDRRFSRKVKNAFFWLATNLVAFPLIRLTHGLRIHGKENYKKNKHLFKNGAITISNHVFEWDFLCVSRAVRPNLIRFPAWQYNFEGPNAGLIRWAGGMPIPTHSIKAMQTFKKDLEEVFSTKKMVHFFPEGSMWYFYPDIRPLKKMVFKYAYKYNRLIIPMAMSFRKRRGITALFTKKPCVDLHIGAPIIPNQDVPAYLEIDRMHKEAYDVMQRLVGITPDMENYRVEQDLENYQKTM